MTPRKTIGTDPLDALVPATKNQRRRSGNAPQAPTKVAPRLRATFQLPHALLERLRSTAYWLSGPPARLSLTRIVESGLVEELARLERQYHKGKPFPPRDGELRGGRPVGS